MRLFASHFCYAGCKQHGHHPLSPNSQRQRHRSSVNPGVFSLAIALRDHTARLLALNATRWCLGSVPTRPHLSTPALSCTGTGPFSLAFPLSYHPFLGLLLKPASQSPPPPPLNVPQAFRPLNPAARVNLSTPSQILNTIPTLHIPFLQH